MSGLPSKYVREDWFGPEAFVAAVVGLVCIALPYAGLVPREAVWLIAAPLIGGGVLVGISAAGLPFSDSVRRVGVGLLVAFAGVPLSIIGLLIGLAVGAAFD